MEFMHAPAAASGGSPAATGGPAASQLLLLVASSESLFVWDVESRRLIQKADAPGTAGSSLTPEGDAGEVDAASFFLGPCAMRHLYQAKFAMNILLKEDWVSHP